MNLFYQAVPLSTFSFFTTHPEKRRELLLGVVSQLSQGAAPLGIALCVHHATGSLTTAGVATAAFAVGSGVARPVQGRAAAKAGLGRALLGCALIHAAGLLLVAIAAGLRGPVAVMVLGAALGGLGLPPISMAMRLTWVPGTGSERSQTYGLVTLTQEAAILLGPLFLGLCSLALSPSGALAVVVLASAAGTLLFGSSASVPPADRSAPSTERVLSRALAWLIATRFMLGMTVGALQLSLIALAIAAGHPALSTVMIATISVGGVIGALLYARRPAASSSAAPAHTRRLALSMAASTIALAVAAMHPHPGNIVLAFAVVIVIGCLLNPTMTTVYLTADTAVKRRVGEAFGWMSTGLFVGTATGNALTGPIIKAAGSGAGFLLAATAAAAIIPFISLAARAARRPQSGPAAT